MSDGAAPLVRYRSMTSDSARWDGFEFRAGDIVISTPAKSGTTWTQMLCALLIFAGADFPEPLGVLSPWIDMPNRAIDDVRATLARQRHRRFVKTHTPLDGIPMRDDVTYLVVGRDPRDIAISFHHHRANMDFERFIEQRAAAVGLDDLDQLPARPPAFAGPAESFRYFITATEWAGPPTLANVLHHFDTAWRRRHESNVALFHFADYVADLPAELRRLASTLRIELTTGGSHALAKEARLDRMRAGAERLAPGASDGHWKSPQAFFRAGGSGEWRDVATAADLAAYDARVAALVPADLAAWAHHGRSGVGRASPGSGGGA